MSTKRLFAVLPEKHWQLNVQTSPHAAYPRRLYDAIMPADEEAIYSVICDWTATRGYVGLVFDSSDFLWPAVRALRRVPALYDVELSAPDEAPISPQIGVVECLLEVMLERCTHRVSLNENVNLTYANSAHILEAVSRARVKELCLPCSCPSTVLYGLIDIATVHPTLEKIEVEPNPHNPFCKITRFNHLFSFNIENPSEALSASAYQRARFFHPKVCFPSLMLHARAGWERALHEWPCFQIQHIDVIACGVSHREAIHDLAIVAKLRIIDSLGLRDVPLDGGQLLPLDFLQNLRRLSIIGCALLLEEEEEN